MTKREFLTAIAGIEEISAELREFATAEITKMDEKNANRKPTKKQLENEAVSATIVEFLTGKEAMIASDIAAALELSTQKVTGLCGQLVKAGTLTKSEVKLPKVGTRVAYAVVTA
jgi:DNA-binding MarR family transcriptional regulator